MRPTGSSARGTLDVSEHRPPGTSRAEEEYFQQIETRFAQLRGTPLLLSPSDVQLVDQWWESGIPLRIVLDAIEEVFRRRQEAPAPRTRPVLSLRYCRHAVEAAFADWREARLGAHPAVSGDGRTPGPKEASDFLGARAREIEALAAAKPAAARGPLHAAAAGLHGLCSELIDPGAPSLISVEARIEALEDELIEALLAARTEQDRRALQEEAAAALAPLRPRLTSAAYQAGIRRHVRGRLREVEGLPRLTLFLL